MLFIVPPRPTLGGTVPKIDPKQQDLLGALHVGGLVCERRPQ
jgi:hypothetical protein